MQLSCYWFDKKRIHSTRNCFQILFFMAHLCLKNSFHKKHYTLFGKDVSHSKMYFNNIYILKKHCIFLGVSFFKSPRESSNGVRHYKVVFQVFSRGF